jgi:hypothetical protein
MIAAGVNAKTLSTYKGHANISITLDRYGHLMPGNEAEAAGSTLTSRASRRAKFEASGCSSPTASVGRVKRPLAQ